MLKLHSTGRTTGTASRGPLVTQPANTDDDLWRRAITNLGRGIGASSLATQALLQGAAEDPELRHQLLEGIDDQLRSMGLVLDNLVQFHSLQRNVLSLDIRSVNLQRWLPALLTKWRSAALRQGLTWREELTPEPLPVRADRDRLAQAVANLLQNAVQHTPMAGDVQVGSGTSGRDAWISISNSGPGLTSDERHRVFEPFFTSARQGQFPKGIGLGLTVADALVRAQAGRIDVKSGAGQGCRFSIWLPLARPQR
jgi:two-component system, OmpR family, sensor kinase